MWQDQESCGGSEEDKKRSPVVPVSIWGSNVDKVDDYRELEVHIGKNWNGLTTPNPFFFF